LHRVCGIVAFWFLSLAALNSSIVQAQGVFKGYIKLVTILVVFVIDSIHIKFGEECIEFFFDFIKIPSL